ncbi:mechanosensitive ion channel family protein [Tenacibaculum maritimum]|uniref:mechanosensitive ion channel family protein n=1 Tax=Tenacibaculum maritimum TaxID=107401 RepID=UPI0010A399F0|nr:mechanosensitive ion channel family protein [Tenacibaculum maritimum]MCD9583878.1 mechanosensitive ion channel family protein [Tenacibaculum maritimum]MCD9610785.1 mechanosensitive ion channel family protein [Tenacibaculum maritimum]MCD9620564.1 mechanosensitive ion channel family protein [Tenacibaculum maritimum]MCD9626589.1 mechanosensitive ion channel family protein [Tenacibaculum maritimum]MCD9629303.1 mechanosensitive ion channel family protein [Tenacibaculum maritimum]
MKNILAILLLISINTFGQKEITVNLSNPNATIYTHLYFLQSDSYQPEKAAKTILDLPTKEAVRKVKKIKQVLDGKGLFVDFSKVPTNPNYNDTIGYTKSYKYVLFPDRMPLISVEKVGENWYYSKETIRNIDALYKEVFPWYVQQIQDNIPNAGHIKLLGVELWQIILLLLLLLGAFIIYSIAKRIAVFILQKLQYRITRSKSIEITSVLKKLAHPVSLLLAVWVIEKIFPSLRFNLEINTWFFLGLHIVATVFWIYVFLKLVQVAMKVYEELAEKTHGRLDDQLVPILRNFLTVIVVFLGILKLLTLLGVDTRAVIAGASIGGLAVALASQDTVKNLIGTFMIFLDKPFHIGDWVEADGIAGEVEEVGFRSSKIRAADTSIYQIPNSKLSEITINNKGLRLYRRYRTTLGLRYDTPPELIEAFVVGVRKIIIAHPETRSESYNVEFTGFGDSSLLIMVNVYFKSLEWGVEQSSKHRFHIAILRLAAALGVDFAFPSSTIMVEQFPGKTTTNLKYEINQEKIDAAIERTVTNFSKNKMK